MKFLVFIYLSLMALSMPALAQNPGSPVKVSGILTDEQGSPVAGASILIQEKTSSNTTTDNGSFLVECTTNDILIFKKAGYNTIIKPASEINGNPVKMSKALIESGDDDIVFIPFGERKKRVVSSSISSIKGNELPQLPLSTLNNVLSGRISGLYIKQTGTRPGTDDASFLIRGRSSYNSGQEPLVLVDGVVRDFVNMDLGEIESISVLKDAPSLSWYGMNAANGVIYVTTKRGSPSATKITLDAQGGIQMPVNITKPLNAYNYALQYNQALLNDNNAARYSAAQLDAYKNGTDPYNYPDNDFVDRFIKKSAPVQRYVATISGGNAFARYFTLLSYYNQDGLYKGAANDKYNANTNYQRFNFRTNLDLHINRNLDVKLDVGGRVENLRYPFAGNSTFLNTVFSTPSNAFPVINENGSYGGSSLFRSNPLAMLNEDGNITDLYRTLLATLNVKQKLDKLVPGLSANVFYTYDITGMFQSGFNQAYEVYESNGSGGYSRYGNRAPLTYRSSTFSGNVRNNEFWAGIDYDRTFGSHGIHFSTRYQRAVSVAPGRLDNTGEGISNRLSYDYQKKYVADIVASYYGSQNFAPGKRFGWFPAVSAGWVISEEKFLSSSRFLDYLKIRGSIGLVGNDGVSARRFAYNNYYTRGGSQYAFGTGYNAVSNATELELANPELTWERALKTTIGFDAHILHESLSLTAEYFHERRTDLLTNALLPNILGQDVVLINGGKAMYKGIETNLTYTKKINQVQIQLNGNFTYAKSKILALNEEAGLPAYQRQVGFPISGVAQNGSVVRQFLVADGIFNSMEQINAAPVQRFSGALKPGDLRYRDINGDNVIDNLDYVMTDYSDIPKAYYGFGGTALYKGFDISFQFQGVNGRTIQINDLINSGTASSGYINQFSPESWTADKGDAALYPRMALSDRGNNTVNSTFWLRSGDYLRLKSAEIGYSITTGIMKKWKLSKCRFYITGFNLLTFSAVNDLPIDPEITTAGYGSNYPYLRTFAGGVSVNF